MCLWHLGEKKGEKVIEWKMLAKRKLGVLEEEMQTWEGGGRNGVSNLWGGVPRIIKGIFGMKVREEIQKGRLLWEEKVCVCVGGGALTEGPSWEKERALGY